MPDKEELARHKKLVEEYCQTFYNDKDFTQAATLLAEDFINHHHGVGGGRDRTISTFRAEIADRFPRFSLTIRKTVAEDDFVWTYGLISLTGEAPTVVSVDIWRVADGRLAEHWDIGAAITDETTEDELLPR